MRMPESPAVYERWLEDNQATGRATSSRAVDMRAALIEHFRDRAEIMIATEAAAEGVNLQFCSLVINYDLPWNPQRIEQRIGRCHRYGQKHDVVVINFLNERNEADRRVLELLTKSSTCSAASSARRTKFSARLSPASTSRSVSSVSTSNAVRRGDRSRVQAAALRDGYRYFGAHGCHTPGALEHFDEDVHARLRMQLRSAREQLDHLGRIFWTLTRYMLRQHAQFDDTALVFDLQTSPRPDIAPGRYHLISKSEPNVTGSFLYRLSHPLGEHLLETGLDMPRRRPRSYSTCPDTRRASRLSRR